MYSKYPPPRVHPPPRIRSTSAVPTHPHVSVLMCAATKLHATSLIENDQLDGNSFVLRNISYCGATVHEFGRRRNENGGWLLDKVGGPRVTGVDMHFVQGRAGHLAVGAGELVDGLKVALAWGRKGYVVGDLSLLDDDGIGRWVQSPAHKFSIQAAYFPAAPSAPSPPPPRRRVRVAFDSGSGYDFKFGKRVSIFVPFLSSYPLLPPPFSLSTDTPSPLKGNVPRGLRGWIDAEIRRIVPLLEGVGERYC